MQYTSQILSRTATNLPPLVPKEIKGDISNLLANSEEASSVDTLEQIIIAIAKHVWPYRQAYMSFVTDNYDRLSHDLLLRYLEGPARQSIKKYLSENGTFIDLHQGAPLHKFEVMLRPAICAAILQTKNEIDAYTRQEVIGVKRSAYEYKINEHLYLLENIEKHLVELGLLAEQENYQNISDEIYHYINAANQGLAGLGPYIGIIELEKYIEHLPGRRKIKLDYLSAYV